MAQRYSTVTYYVVVTRALLQDRISPYRYPDVDITGALNHAMAEIARVRADLFLDLKYQNPLRRGDIDDGLPPDYGTADLAFLMDGITYDPTKGTLVPVPSKYIDPVTWYMSGWLQFYDVADTQDQRAQAMLGKFQQQLMTLSAA